MLQLTLSRALKVFQLMPQPIQNPQTAIKAKMMN